MPSLFDYKLLRDKANTTNEADNVLTQTIPPVGELKTLAGSGDDIIRPVEVELVVLFLDMAGVIVTTGRGSFDVNILRIVDAPSAATIVVDSAPVSAVGGRPLLIDDMRVGDQFGVRLSNIVVPMNATAMRILYKEGLEQ